MKTLERLVAEKLLKIKAVKLQPANHLPGLQVGNLLFTMTIARHFHIRLSVVSSSWN